MQDNYKKGLNKFYKEAQTLAQFHHPSIIPILTSFKENNTAYFVMRYIPGQSLAQYVKQLSGEIAEQEILDIIKPVLEGLKEIHKKGLLHLDVKPQNIYIPEQGDPLLLDFGSARQEMIDADISFSTIFLTDGYAPIEQYSSKAKQTACTDIYACAATIVCLFTRL